MRLGEGDTGLGRAGWTKGLRVRGGVMLEPEEGGVVGWVVGSGGESRTGGRPWKTDEGRDGMG